MNICVFGSASRTLEEIYYTETEKLGKKLGEAGHTLIFGAGQYGMMGAAARGFLSAGADCIGVVPYFFLGKGLIQDGCKELVHHETMRERKKYMEDNSDAFIVAPGGIGTFDEFFEILTLKNLGQMDKPIIFLNTNGYYDPLFAFLDGTIKQHFTAESVPALYEVAATVDEVADLLEKALNR